MVFYPNLFIIALNSISIYSNDEIIEKKIFKNIQIDPKFMPNLWMLQEF